MDKTNNKQSVIREKDDLHLSKIQQDDKEGDIVSPELYEVISKFFTFVEEVDKTYDK